MEADANQAHFMGCSDVTVLLSLYDGLAERSLIEKTVQCIAHTNFDSTGAGKYFPVL